MLNNAWTLRSLFWIVSCFVNSHDQQQTILHKCSTTQHSGSKGIQWQQRQSGIVLRIAWLWNREWSVWNLLRRQGCENSAALSMQAQWHLSRLCDQTVGVWQARVSILSSPHWWLWRRVLQSTIWLISCCLHVSASMWWRKKTLFNSVVEKFFKLVVASRSVAKFYSGTCISMTGRSNIWLLNGGCLPATFDC